MRIKISTTLQWPIHRQFSKTLHSDITQLVINQETDECDAWVIYQGLLRPETTHVPKNRIFLFTYEPPGLHLYNQQFLSQFSSVISCQQLQHPSLIQKHQAQPWLAGIRRRIDQNVHRSYEYGFDCDGFSAMKPVLKTKLLSAVCSNKSMVPGHKKRLELVELLRKELKDKFDLFGYGFSPIEDKWEALEPYSYHLVLENSSIPNYWTEKLADAYLSWCFPIVWGCTNLSTYFPEDSFLLLDPNTPERSAELIMEFISNPLSAIQQRAVAEARRRILEEYNLFSEIISLCKSSSPFLPERVRLRDERLFLPGGWIRPFARFFTDRWRRGRTQ